MKKILFLFALVVAQLFAVNAADNEFYLRGHILDADTGDHVSHATVAIVGTTMGCVADDTGHFFLNGIKPGSYKVRVATVGYTPEVQDIVVTPGLDKIELTFNI